MARVLVDGDILAYRAAFATQDGLPKDAEEKVEVLLDFVLEETLDFPTPEWFEVYLTGSNNFRFDIAKSYPYKGNRESSEKPKHLKHVRDYLINKFGAIVSEGEEADDQGARGLADAEPDGQRDMVCFRRAREDHRGLALDAQPAVDAARLAGGQHQGVQGRGHRGDVAEEQQGDGASQGGLGPLERRLR